MLFIVFITTGGMICEESNCAGEFLISLVDGLKDLRNIKCIGYSGIFRPNVVFWIFAARKNLGYHVSIA